MVDEPRLADKQLGKPGKGGAVEALKVPVYLIVAQPQGEDVYKRQRLYDVSEGTLKVGGIDVRNYDLEVLRDNVAMVRQKNELFSGTIKENLRWGNPNATDEELEEACRLSQADEFIQQDVYKRQGLGGGGQQALPKGT